MPELDDSTMKVYLGIEDSYLPAIPKPSLQQYDNYQIYDMHCVDILYEHTVGQSILKPNPRDVQSNWLAVQVYSIGIIPCDFNKIVSKYH